jgi:hypothetical protein
MGAAAAEPVDLPGSVALVVALVPALTFGRITDFTPVLLPALAPTDLTPALTPAREAAFVEPDFFMDDSPICPDLPRLVQTGLTAPRPH